MRRQGHWDRAAWLAACAACAAAAVAGQIRAIEECSPAGVVQSVAAGVVVVRDDAGTRHEVRVQAPDEQGVALADGTRVAFPAEVRVSGSFDVTKLKPGQMVRIESLLGRRGPPGGEVTEVVLLGAGDKPAIDWHAGPPAAATQAACTITAVVKQVAKGALVVECLPTAELPRVTALRFKLAAGVQGRYDVDDPGRIEAGALVVKCRAVRLSTGDVVARSLAVRNPAAAAVASKEDEALATKYRKLSADPPPKPRDVRSAHFAFTTDLSDREAAIVLDKLERMAGMLQSYFRRPATGVVEGFVVRDLAAWANHPFEQPLGVEKIRSGAGVCFNSRLGDQRRAVLYSCADHGVIQHECMHGLCHMTFGSTGPTWLAEGVAELGNYWREGQREVDIDPVVMGFLRNAQPKRRLLEIAVPGRTDAGSWQDYAWRWALCHLLANNPNYTDRFQPLAIALMEERPDASFESAYGSVARELSFEYDLFLRTVGNGYRADLAAWPWQDHGKARPLAVEASAKIPRVKAAAGWQATRVRVERGAAYELEATGTWRTSAAGPALTAAGDADGHGRLLAAVLRDEAGEALSLGDEFPVGAGGPFTAPDDGTLFVRCDDAWTELGDNSGELSVTVRRAAAP